MKILKLIFKNAFRHKLRTFLTILGIGIAVMGFALMRFVVNAWYAGVEVAAADRLIVRHAVSFVFQLPYSYAEKVRSSVPGVRDVTNCTWFNGVYKDSNDWKNYFPRIAVNPENFFKLYPEFKVPQDQLETFQRERNSCILGIKTAKVQNLKIGDIIQVEGDIYPGTYQFVIRGIYTGRDRGTDETQMFFDWRYLDEAVKKNLPTSAGQVGWYVLQVDNPNDIANISSRVDALFKNSAAETKTETEKAFNQSFISMYSTLFTAMNFVSFVVIGVILLVLANTMAMSARERINEYAVMKTIGFSGKHLAALIAGEAIFISIIGGIIGLVLAVPAALGFAQMFPTWFPNLPNLNMIVILAFAAAILVGIASAFFPALRASRMRIVDGLRYIG
ncbi:ABC transporter permease [bacterium]|nr:ABC transporter permease [bacterium]